MHHLAINKRKIVYGDKHSRQSAQVRCYGSEDKKWKVSYRKEMAVRKPKQQMQHITVTCSSSFTAVTITKNLASKPTQILIYSFGSQKSEAGFSGIKSVSLKLYSFWRLEGKFCSLTFLWLMVGVSSLPPPCGSQKE